MPVEIHLAAEPLDPRLRELYRTATPTQKLAVVSRLNAALLGLKAAEITVRRPELSQSAQSTLLRHWWLTAAT